MAEFPSNAHGALPGSNPSSDAKVPAKEVKRITTSAAVQRKKPLSTKFRDTFLRKDAIANIWSEIVVPQARYTASDAFDVIKNRILFGDSVPPPGHRGTRSGIAQTYTNYNRMSAPGGPPRRDDPRGMTPQARSMFDFNQIVIPNRVEAEDVLSHLFELVSSYGVASVRDLYEMVGEHADYTDDAWGWTDMRGSRVVTVREGYLLDLPRPIDIS